MSFSREAMHESQKKNTRQLPTPVEQSAQAAHRTAPLPPPPLPDPPLPGSTAASVSAAPPPQQPLPSGKQTPSIRSHGPHLDHYVSEMNQEINRVSNAVGSRLDNLGDRVSDAFRRLFEPLAETLMGLAEALAQALHKITVGLIKALLQELTFVLRTLTDKLLDGNHSSSSRSATPMTQSPSPTENYDEQIPSFRAGFGQLIELRIFFSTIHNRPFLTEKDIREFRPGNKRQEYEWMTRALEEIRNCAPYGQKLPTPTKGPFMGVPMHDILRDITYSDLENFLIFVSNRPQPFQQKPLKLSEAYATWAHKGAPSH